VIVSLKNVEERVLAALKKVLDPELGVNVVDLGLLRGIEISEGPIIKIKMTLTTPGCPMGFFILGMAKKKVEEEVKEAKEVSVELVLDPPWTPLDLTEEGRRILKERLNYDPVELYLKRYGPKKEG